MCVCHVILWKCMCVCRVILWKCMCVCRVILCALGQSVYLSFQQEWPWEDCALCEHERVLLHSTKEFQLADTKDNSNQTRAPHYRCLFCFEAILFVDFYSQTIETRLKNVSVNYIHVPAGFTTLSIGMPEIWLKLKRVFINQSSQYLRISFAVHTLKDDFIAPLPVIHFKWTKLSHKTKRTETQEPLNKRHVIK